MVERLAAYWITTQYQEADGSWSWPSTLGHNVITDIEEGRAFMRRQASTPGARIYGDVVTFPQVHRPDLLMRVWLRDRNRQIVALEGERDDSTGGDGCS